MNLFSQQVNDCDKTGEENFFSEQKLMIDRNINTRLKKATLEFFPKIGVWSSSCFHLPEELCMSNLPCHLRDYAWLAQMLRIDQQLLDIPFYVVLNYVCNDSFFLEQRHAYEQEIVRWQIDWMKKGGGQWLIGDNYGGDLFFLTSDCDLGFRKGIVDTLSAIGIPSEVIEEGIERNADKWRDYFMNLAFRNEYEPVFADLSGYLASVQTAKKVQRLRDADIEHREKWITMRKYEYYQRHKESVDRYGIVSADMVLTSEQVRALQFYLNQKHAERIEQMERYQYGMRQIQMQKKA